MVVEAFEKRAAFTKSIPFLGALTTSDMTAEALIQSFNRHDHLSQTIVD
jgi:hypothetical protein